MPLVKQSWARTPNAFTLNTVGTESIGPLNIAASQANTATQGFLVLPCAVKISKVSIGWSAITDATPSFNLVYNTNQAIGGALSYTAGNVAPNDNSMTGGFPNAAAVAAANPQPTLAGGLTSAQLTGAITGSPGYPNPALTALYPTLQQIGGLGVPTNFAVDGQPLFVADVVFNTTNFPGSGTTGGFGVLIPTNYDAVYPSGPNGPAAVTVPALANLPGAITLRVTTAAAKTITGLTVTVLYEPISIRPNISTNPAESVITPGQDF
jgi:hypothetical protein